MKKLLLGIAISLCLTGPAWCATYEKVTGDNEVTSADDVVVKETKSVETISTVTPKDLKNAIQRRLNAISSHESRITELEAEITALQARLTPVEVEAAKANLLVLPTADFSADKSSGVAPLAVVFTDKSTGDIKSYTWDFGDEEMSIEASPKHTYAEAGTYKAVLTVTGPKGHTSTKAVEITVTEAQVVEPK